MASFERKSTDEDNVHDSLLPPQVYGNSAYRDSDEVKVYSRRWYVLAVYCCANLLQSMLWNTWGPIQATARAVYQWQDYMIDLMPAFGTFTFCFAVAPFAWLMDVKGLRVAVMLATAFLSIGSALRCIPTSPGISTILICCGQTIIGFATPVCLGAMALLSSTWFPPHQRTTTTAIGSLATGGGLALSFLIGPAFVDDVGSTDIPKTGDNYVLNSTMEHKYNEQINRLLYVEAGVMLVIFLAVLIYYPARPPKPPSHSAATERVDFKNGLKKLFKNYHFLLVVLIYGANGSFYAGWCAVLDQNLSEYDLGVSQNFAGWLGFVATICGSFSGILFSRLADYFSGRLKLFLMIFISLLFYTVLSIWYVFTKIIPYNEILLYFQFALSGVFLNGSTPLFFELSVEMTYPVAEGITSSALTSAFSVIQLFFFVVPLAHLGTKWMVQTIAFTCAASTVLLYFINEKYNRSTEDRNKKFTIITPDINA